MTRLEWIELETLALRFADTGIYPDLTNFSDADATATLAMLRSRLANESAVPIDIESTVSTR
jgi:hypothetical protein